jgi:formylglycine-generating enzyme required for sulfatase activity
VTRPTPPYGDESFGYGKGKQPAINMTWHAAMEYCRWLSAKTGKAYRLPTEAEWEFAARAGTTAAYSFGDDPRALGDYGWTRENSGERPHAVASKKPNAWGLFDMHGNVSEWILDQYDADAYRKVEPGTVGPVLLPGNHRFRTSRAADRGTMGRRWRGARLAADPHPTGAGAIRRARRASGGTPTPCSPVSASSAPWRSRTTSRDSVRPLPGTVPSSAMLKKEGTHER